MQKKTNSNQIKSIIPALLFALVMVLNYACDPIATETCEEVPDLCEEEVRVCSSTDEEYYVLGSDTIYCSAVGNCSSAESKLVNSCTVASIQNEIEIKQRLEAIMMSVRSNQY